MENFDHNLWRGAHPDYTELSKDRFDWVFDLEPQYDEIWQEMLAGRELNIRVSPLPLCMVFPPSLSATTYIVKELATAGPFKVLIHCQKGVDRTGYIVAAYRVMVQGWSINSACAEWKAKGRSPWLGWWEYQFRKDVKPEGGGE